MKNIAEFQIIGRVGKIKSFGNTTRISICANYPKRDNQGQWEDDPHWNEVVVFADKTRNYIRQYIDNGDLVHVRGKIRQNSFSDKKTGEERYTVDLIVLDFGLLCKKKKGIDFDQLDTELENSEIPEEAN